MFPLLMAINPLVGKIQDVRSTQLKFGASARSFWVLVALGLIVAGLFVYLYWHEWWLERGFRRYRVGLAGNANAPQALADVPPRKSLVALDAATKPPKREPPKAARELSSHLNDRPTPGWQISRGVQPGGAPNSSSAVKSTRGVVLVQAEDSFHEIYVDDQFVGNAPARLNLIEGRHSIELRKPGFIPYRRELQVFAEAEVHFRAQLEPASVEFVRR